jgi:hypothetical protein
MVQNTSRKKNKKEDQEDDVKGFWIPVQTLNYIRFEVFMAVTMKNAVFWDVAPCRSCVNRRFGGTYRLNLKGRKKPGCGEPA